MENSPKKKSLKKWLVIFWWILGITLINLIIPFKYNPKEYTIAGLKPWCSINEAINILGEPLSKSESDGIEHWIYPGITLIIISGVDSVEEIVLTSDKYHTYRGIKVGDAFEKVSRKYWFVKKEKYFLDISTLLGSFNGAEQYSIRFSNLNGKVSLIVYSCRTD